MAGKRNLVRYIDDYGRIMLPPELRRKVGFEEGESLELIPDGDTVVLKKAAEDNSPIVIVQTGSGWRLA